MLLFSLNPANPDSSTILWIIFLVGMFALGFAIAWLLFKDKSASNEEEGDSEYGDSSYDLDALRTERDEAVRNANTYAAQLDHCQTDLDTKVMDMTAENNDLKLALESCRKGLLEEGVPVTPRPSIADLPAVHTASDLNANQLLSLEEVKIERDRLETKLIAANGALSVIGNSYGIEFNDERPNDLLDKVKELGAQHKELTAKIAKLEKDKTKISSDLEECKANLTNVIGAGEFTVMPFGTEDPEKPAKKKTKAKAKPKAKVAPKKAAPKKSKEEILSNIADNKSRVDFATIGTTTAAEKDDLKVISGIGPFIEKKLNALGIYTFEQVSKFTDEIANEVTDIIQFFPGRIQRDNWIGQAKDLHAKK